MSKLPIINARDFERLLINIGFELKRQKVVTSSIGIQMAGIQPCLTIQGGIYLDR